MVVAPWVLQNGNIYVQRMRSAADQLIVIQHATTEPGSDASDQPVQLDA